MGCIDVIACVGAKERILYEAHGFKRVRDKGQYMEMHKSHGDRNVNKKYRAEIKGAEMYKRGSYNHIIETIRDV